MMSSQKLILAGKHVCNSRYHFQKVPMKTPRVFKFRRMTAPTPRDVDIFEADKEKFKRSARDLIH